ncbi:hypothetical protein [Hoyosella subflava]|uniref:Uncharacterized protein n=1 Tax=Hoyosella subflava (strain DSM 45089 / JCM 17490 / NBRC 109087 / DQS3-9A1) TaxID=443218 RepID=F6ELJ1_HOYSD|nr:hypothetical protein [Hoyosella subflava]AEF40241.1 hypothetical protein AS9A_1792 [Hoyosella subflava DQS3-9A1]
MTQRSLTHARSSYRATDIEAGIREKADRTARWVSELQETVPMPM